MSSKIGLLVSLLFGLPVYAAAQVRDASYFCVSEISGGIAYDATHKTWISTTFKPTEQFVLHVKYAGPRAEKMGSSFVSTYDDYYVTVTPSGTNQVMDCIQVGSNRRTVDFDPETKLGNCTGILSNFRFNLNNNRFLETYPIGYVDGYDNNQNTPAVSGGTCTKIQ